MRLSAGQPRTGQPMRVMQFPLFESLRHGGAVSAVRAA